MKHRNRKTMAIFMGGLLLCGAPVAFADFGSLNWVGPNLDGLSASAAMDSPIAPYNVLSSPSTAANDRLYAVVGTGRSVTRVTYNVYTPIEVIPAEKLAVTTAVYPSMPLTTLATGERHSLAVSQDGSVWSWGSSTGAQGGDGKSSLTSPMKVSGLRDIRSVSAKGIHSLALQANGQVWAWGNNSFGQLGTGSEESHSGPVVVLDNVAAIASGTVHSVALKKDGTVWTWGYNVSGQLGDGTTATRWNPVQVSGLNHVTAISSSGSSTLALKDDGTVWAWGDNYAGQLGDGTKDNRSIPVQVSVLTNVYAIASGGYHSMALQSDGSVWTWGDNRYGQLGDGTTTGRLKPERIAGLDNVSMLAGGLFHSLAIRKDGTVWSWGNNQFGQLGDGTTINKSLPVKVRTIDDARTIDAGTYSSAAKSEQGKYFMWGENSSGQLGNGTTSPSRIPITVVDLNGDDRDTTSPTAPENVTVTGISTNLICIAWTDATDNVGVAGYDVYRDNVKIGSSPTTSYIDKGLNASTSYVYTVRAKDGAGNTSAPGNAITAATLVEVDALQR
ncbi:hypothetical protein [Paenibacillus sp. RC67]|uniref:RCC1 domain-containing protein n=1 Tax=Paenibacillus sp. RC67 TaxID=3039392 RepID=UPI0024AD283C|nr:hypothetical protein [Paenibacillus sp. RC67]